MTEIKIPLVEPTIGEVMEIIIKSNRGRAPGADGINEELIKDGGEKFHKKYLC